MKLWVSKCDGKYYLSSTKDAMSGVEIPTAWGEEMVGQTVAPIEITIKANIKESLQDRAERFRKRCEEYIPKYGETMVSRFVYYWTESNGTKMRWEKQDVFDISRRLSLWARKDKERQQQWEPMETMETKPRTKSIDDLMAEYEARKH